MALNKPKTWLDQAVDRPKAIFATPADVLRDERLDEAGMRAVLEAWEHDVRRTSQEPAAADAPQLKAVLRALAELDRLERVMSA